jgi:hypothetical protein
MVAAVQQSGDGRILDGDERAMGLVIARYTDLPSSMQIGVA